MVVEQASTLPPAGAEPEPYEPNEAWVSQEEINLWVAALVEVHNSVLLPTGSGHGPLLSSGDSTLLPLLKMHRDDESYLVDHCKRLHPTMRLDRVCKCLVPLHVDAVHWVLLVIMPQERLLCIYDSFNDRGGLSPTLRDALWMITRFLRLYAAANGVPQLSAAPWVPVSCPYASPQTDDVSCGIYVAIAAALACRCYREMVTQITLGRRNVERVRETLQGLTQSKEGLRILAHPEAFDAGLVSQARFAWFNLLSEEHVACGARRVTRVYSPESASSSPEPRRLSDRFAFRCVDPRLDRSTPAARGHVASPNSQPGGDELDLSPPRLCMAGGMEVLLVHPSQGMKQLQLELYENMTASAASYACSPDPAPDRSLGECVSADQSRALGATHLLGARTMYTEKRPYELRILAAALGELLQSLEEEEDGGFSQDALGSGFLVGSQGELSSSGDLFLPCLAARALHGVLAARDEAAMGEDVPSPPRVDLVLAGGTSGRVHARVRDHYEAAGMSCHVDPGVFLSRPVTSPDTPRMSYRKKPPRLSPASEEEDAQTRILRDMVMLDNMCCVRECLPDASRMLVLMEEQEYAQVPDALRDDDYAASLWVRDEGVYKGSLWRQLVTDSQAPLTPLGPTRSPRHVASMLRWGLSPERSFVVWKPGPGQARMVEPRTFLLCVHWMSKKQVWSFLVGGPHRLNAERMAACEHPPVQDAGYFPFCELFELY